jgi:hypothetical protein
MAMGADFVFAVAPACTLTKERSEELEQIIDTLEYSDCPEWDEEEAELEDVQEGLRAAVSEYAIESREIGVFCPDETFPYKVTGGMSWGDAPTEAYQHFLHLEQCPKIWHKLVEWAKEDHDG